MDEIKYKYGPYLFKDERGKTRYTGILPNGVKTSRARLVMMNFLHCQRIPKSLHIHHINGDTTNDSINNLEIMKMISHLQYHHPRDYSRYGVSSSGNRLAYGQARRADVTIREKRLSQRRDYYQRKFKNDPDYILKNRKRAKEYYEKIKGGRKDENRSI